jgi:hypothetical protein
VRREWFEVPLHLELFDALVAVPQGPAAELAGRLTPPAMALWSELREAGGTMTEAVLDDHYASASEALEFRPHWRAYKKLTDPGEKLRRKKELDAKYARALRKAMQWQNPRSRTPQ